MILRKHHDNDHQERTLSGGSPGKASGSRASKGGGRVVAFPIPVDGLHAS
jgi:hypothetical protein